MPVENDIARPVSFGNATLVIIDNFYAFRHIPCDHAQVHIVAAFHPTNDYTILIVCIQRIHGNRRRSRYRTDARSHLCKRLIRTVIIIGVGNVIRPDERNTVCVRTRKATVRQARLHVHTVGNQPALNISVLGVVVNGIRYRVVEEGKDRHIVAREVEHKEIVQAVITIKAIIGHIFAVRILVGLGKRAVTTGRNVRTCAQSKAYHATIFFPFSRGIIVTFTCFRISSRQHHVFFQFPNTFGRERIAVLVNPTKEFNIRCRGRKRIGIAIANFHRIIAYIANTRVQGYRIIFKRLNIVDIIRTVGATYDGQELTTCFASTLYDVILGKGDLRPSILGDIHTCAAIQFLSITITKVGCSGTVNADCRVNPERETIAKVRISRTIRTELKVYVAFLGERQGIIATVYDFIIVMKIRNA